MAKREIDTYNDGVVRIYREKKKKNEYIFVNIDFNVF